MCRVRRRSLRCPDADAANSCDVRRASLCVVGRRQLAHHVRHGESFPAEPPNLRLAWLLYQFVGKWPVPIVMWGIGAQLLLRARREMILKKRSETVHDGSSDPIPSSATATVATTSASMPRLHRILMAGLVVTATLLLLLRYRGLDPELSPDVKMIMEYVCSAGSAVLVAVALIVFKPRVPGRRSEQSVEQYWSTPDVAASVSLVWFLMEGGGMIAAVGYFLTGGLLAETTMSLAIAAFWFCGPSRFAKA